MRAVIDGVIEVLKSRGITEFAATGYCFSGKQVFDLARDGVIKAAIVAHPSLLVIPDDLEAVAKTNVPVLINR